MAIIINRRKSLFNKVWLEKYRPTSINDIVMDDQMKSKFSEFITNEDFPSLLLVGSPGTGKTTMAYILLDNAVKNEGDFLELNGSLFGTIDVVRNTIVEFIKTKSFFSKKKFIFIDEADKLSDAAQDSLRNLMEQSSDHISFILTANYLHKISEPLQSRLQTFMFKSMPEEYIFNFVKDVLQKENIRFEEDSLRYIVKATMPDMRRCMNEINKAVYNSGNERYLSINNTSESFKGEQGFINQCIDFYNIAVQKQINNNIIKSMYTMIDNDSIDFRRVLEALAHKLPKVRMQTLAAHFFNTSKDCISIKMHMMEFIGEYILICTGLK